MIAGHGRLRAAKELGLDEVPTIALSGLGDPEKRALRIADNKIALGAGWDLDLLKLEIGELATLDVDLDLTLTGFSTGEIDVILADTPDPDDETIPAVPETPRTQPGDIWELGDHRIGCGDARDLDFLQNVIGSGRVDAAFLDPPYNVAINGHANSKSRHREFAMASGEISTTEFHAFLSETLGACVEVSRDGAVHFVCMDWRHMDDVSVLPPFCTTLAMARIPTAEITESVIQGKVHGPETAKTAGFLDHLCQPEDMLEEAVAYATEMAKLPTETYLGNKLAMRNETIAVMQEDLKTVRAITRHSI